MANDLRDTPSTPRTRPAILQSFDAVAWTATVQVTGSLATYLTGVPVAKNLNAELLPAGSRVGVLFFDDSNPTDAVVSVAYGAVPPAWITTGMIVDGTIATGDIADLAVTTAKLADLGVTEGKLGNLAVTTGKIADLAVTTGKIADLAVTTAKIADLAVTTGKIAALAVGEEKLGNLAVTTGKIVDLAVTTAKLADLGVTEGKLAASAVTSAKIADGTIVGADCSANVANGVATYDANGYLTLPSRLYPSNQATRYLYDDGSRMRTNGWLRATDVHADAAEGVFLAGADAARYSRFMNRIVATNYMAILGVNSYPNGASWYRDDTAKAASIVVCHDSPAFYWYTTPAGGSDPLTWTQQLLLDTSRLEVANGITVRAGSAHTGAGASIYYAGSSTYIYSHDSGGGDTNKPIYVYGNPTYIAAGGLVCGSPTGGDKGTGTINAVSVYRDGTALDRVFEPGYRLATIAQMRRHFHEEKCLPTLRTADVHQDGCTDEGALTDALWETAEVHAIYIAQLHDRITRLEKRLTKTPTHPQP